MAYLEAKDLDYFINLARQAPTCFRAEMPKESVFPVVWDSGASLSISLDCDDFIGPIKKPTIATILKGIAKGLQIQGQGHVSWTIQDTNGQLRSLKVPAFYVPACGACLLSTSSLLQMYPDERILFEEGSAMLRGAQGSLPRRSIIARVNPKNNLPTSIAYQYGGVTITTNALASTISVVDDLNGNLSEPEKELLRWHFCLGHLAFKKVQFLM